jgi:xylan 1,4-beta-xylosidase
VCVLVWHYHDDDLPGPAAAVELSVGGLPADAGRVLLHHYRIDENHSNAYAAWKALESPSQPTPEQYARLERAAQLALLTSPGWVRAEGGAAVVRFPLPRQAVSLLAFSW